MGRSTRHPNAADEGSKRDSATAAEYLEKQRGEESAALIVEAAQILGAALAKPAAPSWNAAKRKRALKLAKELRPLWHQGAPGLTASVLDAVIARWTREAATQRRGRPLSNSALFAQVMLEWAAGELGARGEKQLTVTELIAAAAIAELPGVDWSKKRGLLDTWRKLWKARLPRSPEPLAAEAQKRHALAKQRAMVEILRRGPKKPGTEKVEEIGPESAEFPPPERIRDAEE